MAERANIAPAEVLYRSRRDDAHHRVYVHRSEEAVLCVGDTQIERPFIQEESYEELRRSHMQYIHLGVIQIRLQVLHRIEQGNLAVLVLRDTRWTGDQATFASMEVDLTRGIQMVYIVPNTMMTIGDFYNHVQVVIQTRGYENWQGGEANLLITRGLVGRLSNTPNVGFAYEIQGVTEFLTSRGVKAIPGEQVSTEILRGRNWIIRPPVRRIHPQQPTTAVSRNLPGGNFSLRFGDYVAAQQADPVHYDQNDNEVMDSEDDNNSIRNEAQNRQETILFFEEQPNVFKETLDQAATRYSEFQRRTEGGETAERRRRQNLPDSDAESRHPSGHQHRQRMMPPESDSESSYPLEDRKKKDKKKAKLCRTCYPMSEYEGFDAVQFIRLTPQASRPTRATDGAVGYDLTSIGKYIIPARDRALIATGIALEIPCGLYGRIASRSGLALYHGIDVGAGVIDTDYRGEVKILLFNHNHEEFMVHAGDRIAQIIFEKVSLPRMVEKDARNLRDIRRDIERDDWQARSPRNNKGFGSTGLERRPGKQKQLALEYRSKEEEDSDSDSTLNIIAMVEEAETEYPQIKKLEELIARRRQQPQYVLSSSSAITSHYNPPQDSIMGPIGYPPATGQGPSINIPERPSYTGGRSNLRRAAHNEMWNLPSAMQQTGAMFVIPQTLGKFDDVFMRWESITRAYVATQGFTDVRDKLMFIENLLGETEKLIWTQWRMRYADEYANLISIGDGNEGTQNIISQMRTVFTLEDPYQGSTLM
ncbi:hypothetical protein HYC85_029650 [Camellia sinensis]|uniref:dUTP diphosphatase n=1 Tax=Camellia sinensis TaxID=4442 RepID=A0A7J7FYQ4_CAMSI|nr:hypothetical protein HYC85_029650 [Camellia sinensis]